MFKVGYEPTADGYRLTITNRRGRKWVKTTTEGCPGNAAEAAMVLQEYLDDGNLLTRSRDYWREASSLGALI